ncbi:PspC domain-containing protein [Psychrobium sp. nBUS_13]|uniref:PspC domain-containing protein n=1 Tax=Psychrobium sp. nBUS_13 TaxID=3395319 RepID=UPI003EBE21BC
MSLLHRFRKDTANGLVAGICAGIARGLNVERKWVRIAALVSLLLFNVATVILYIILAVVLPPKNRWLD